MQPPLIPSQHPFSLLLQGFFFTASLPPTSMSSWYDSLGLIRVLSWALVRGLLLEHRQLSTVSLMEKRTFTHLVDPQGRKEFQEPHLCPWWSAEGPVLWIPVLLSVHCYVGYVMFRRHLFYTYPYLAPTLFLSPISWYSLNLGRISVQLRLVILPSLILSLLTNMGFCINHCLLL